MPEELGAGQVPVTMKWCEDNNLKEHAEAAIINEIESVRRNNVFDFVKETEFPQAKRMTGKIVLTVKLDLTNRTVKKVKARWVVRGFTDPRIEEKAGRDNGEMMRK